MASLRKFFSSPDGGVLIGKNIPTVLTAVKPNIKHELHATLQMLLQAAEFGRLGLLGKLLQWLDRYRSKLKHSLPEQPITSKFPAKSMRWNWFDPNLMEEKGLRVSKILMKYCRLSDIVEIRRKNYTRLIAGISGIENLQPLFPVLPDHVAPYMVPLLLNSGESDFERLMREGIPIWRWEELAVSDCKVSQSYRLQLLQIPCHQDLDAAEIDWICSKLIDTLAQH